MNSCEIIFNALINIPLEQLSNYGVLEECGIINPCSKAVYNAKYHDLSFSIELNKSLAIWLILENGASTKLECESNSDIRTLMDNYIVKYKQYTQSLAINALKEYIEQDKNNETDSLD